MLTLLVKSLMDPIVQSTRVQNNTPTRIFTVRDQLHMCSQTILNKHIRVNILV